MPSIDDLKRAMTALPAKVSVADQTVKVTIKRLHAQIHQLHFEKKWTWSEIAAWLTENGVKITENTLRLYYYKSAPRAAPPRRAAADSAAVAPTPASRATPAASTAAGAAVEAASTLTPSQPSPTGRVNPVLD